MVTDKNISRSTKLMRIRHAYQLTYALCMEFLPEDLKGGWVEQELINARKTVITLTAELEDDEP